MTSPVIYMPLNQDLINANLTVEQLQEFQHVDNVVEVQLQPSPAPPQSTTVVDTAFFDRVTNMMNTFDNLIPLLTKVASDRRSPTAGASENVSLNPVASHSDSAPQVPVVAPQDPGLAPGPSSASSEPIASTSGLQQRHHDAFASPRGRSGERDSAERSRHASPSLQGRLRRQMDDVRRQLVNAKEIVDVYSSQGRLPPDQARYDLEFFQDRYAQLHVAYEDSLASSTFHSHGPSPAPHVVASPVFTPVAATPGSSSLARPSHHIASVAVLNATISESLLATSLSLVADPVPGNRSSLLRLAVHLRRGDQPPGGLRRLVGPLCLLRGESPHGEPLRLLRGIPLAEPHRLPRGESPPRGHLLLSV